MIRDVMGAAGFTVVWPVGLTPSSSPPASASNGDWITRRLDLARARLDTLEASLATLPPHTPPTDQQAQELHELQLLVADVTTDLLGADHPLVAQCVRSHLKRWSPARA